MAAASGSCLSREVSLVYAIDFGTSNSLLAAGRDGQVLAPIPIDPAAKDPSVLRSLIYFENDQKRTIGAQALLDFRSNDLQGRLLRSLKKFLPSKSFTGTTIITRTMSLEDLIASILRELRERANLHFGQDVRSAVFGRPARFSEEDDLDQFAQDRLEKAARLAGFEQIEFMPEPLAAAFELRQRIQTSQLALVADFGGGTSDFTVIQLSKKDFSPSDVLAIGGVSVAGDAVDGAVMRNRFLPYFGSEVEYRVPFGSNVLKMPIHLMDKLSSPADVAILRKPDVREFFKNVQQWSVGKGDREKLDRLFQMVDENLGFEFFEAIEKTKRELSDQKQSQFAFDVTGIEIQEKITRSQFDAHIAVPTEKILASLDDTLKRAQVRPEQIDTVFSTGGTAKIPLLKSALIERFGEAKVQEQKHFHSIVEGLAVRAAELSR